MSSGKKIIFATAVLKSGSNINILKNPGLTAADIGKAQADRQTVEKAMEELKKLGFEINVADPLMLSVSGSKDLFEQVFKMNLEEQVSNGVSYFKTKKKVIPASLKNYLLDIVFAEPMELFY
jgi:subtilase family serine protease